MPDKQYFDRQYEVRGKLRTYIDKLTKEHELTPQELSDALRNVTAGFELKQTTATQRQKT